MTLSYGSTSPQFFYTSIKENLMLIFSNTFFGESEKLYMTFPEKALCIYRPPSRIPFLGWASENMANLIQLQMDLDTTDYLDEWSLI